VITPAGAILGTSVTLVSLLASDPTGNPLTFAWDFGDGTTGTGEATTHVYANEGDFFPKVTVTNGEGSFWGTATTALAVKSLTARWSGDMDAVHGRVSITQDGLDLTGTYQDDAHTSGSVAGTISATGEVTFTVTRAGIAPFTFTGTAGPDVETLVGSASGRDIASERWQLARD
jgi:PKD repeat protein